MAGRSEKRVTEAIEVVCAAMPDSKGSLLWLPLDLADLRSIKGAVENFLTKETRLDVLWDNAGVMFPSGTVKTEQVGFSITDWAAE
ncbi:short chain dehydrogenase reductase [Penicillium pulvis]|uniref:short chain dehydrogenase reductase n=1 Tax=Penicillium pulvis TaxID=1562058 RepID=UPI002548EA11|nr:short chain dehydrogenase reductase [Penicillium pulvis]KAJ5805704.1 short chain dehydrogenase reductase [Penicillium pulvis]